MSGNSYDNVGGETLSTILSVWDDYSVNLDDKVDWSRYFCQSCLKVNNETKELAHIAKTPWMHILI